MRRGKTVWYRMALSVILLAAAMVSLVGVTWARYQTKLAGDLNYEAKEFAEVYLWSIRNGELSETPSVWSGDDESQTLHFCISNGTGEAAAKASQQVYVRLLGGPGLQDTDEVSVSLYVIDTRTRYEGSVQMIQEDTVLYQNHGPGWLFTFHDEDGEEVSLPLEGQKLSVIEAEIELQGNAKDTTLLQLQVWGEITD